MTQRPNKKKISRKKPVRTSLTKALHAPARRGCSPKVIGYFNPESGVLTTPQGTISVPFQDGFQGKLKHNKAHGRRINAISRLDSDHEETLD